MNRLYILFLCLFSGVLYAQKGGEIKIENYFNYFNYQKEGFKSYDKLMITHILYDTQVAEIQGGHQLNMGLSGVENYTTSKFLDRLDLVAYYQYKKEDWLFKMGLFPKEIHFKNYPFLLFSEEVLKQKPLLNGFLVEKLYKNGYAHLWLDWTGFDRNVSKESFFVGATGGYDKGIFYLRHHSYLFHWLELLDRNNPNGAVSVKDNAKTLTSVGLQYQSKNHHWTAKMALGYVLSFERDRGTSQAEAPMGVLWEVEGSYRWFSVKNTKYFGQVQAVFYPTYGKFLYWGDTYQKGYNRTDFTFKLYQKKAYEFNFQHSIHHIGGGWVHQERVVLSVFFLNFNY